MTTLMTIKTTLVMENDSDSNSNSDNVNEDDEDVMNKNKMFGFLYGVFSAEDCKKGDFFARIFDLAM